MLAPFESLPIVMVGTVMTGAANSFFEVVNRGSPRAMLNRRWLWMTTLTVGLSNAAAVRSTQVSPARHPAGLFQTAY